MLISLMTTACLLAPLSAPRDVQWQDGSFDRLMRQAQAERLPTMVYFWRNGSEYCTQMYQETLSNEQCQESMQDFLCYSANYDTPAGAALFNDFKFQTLPMVLFLTPDGEADYAVGGFMDAGSFHETLAMIKRGEGTITGFKRRMQEVEEYSDEDFELRYKMADMLKALSSNTEAEKLLESIRLDDSRGKSYYGGQALMDQVVKEIEEDGGGWEHLSEWELDPLYDLVKKIKNDAARHDGYESLASFEFQREDYTKAHKNIKSAWKYVPEDKQLKFAEGVALWLMEFPDDSVNSKLRNFALELATLAVSMTDALEPGTDAYAEQYGEHDKKVLCAKRRMTLAKVFVWMDRRGDAEKVVLECEELGTEDEHVLAYIEEFRKSA